MKNVYAVILLISIFSHLGYSQHHQKKYLKTFDTQAMPYVLQFDIKKKMKAISAPTEIYWNDILIHTIVDYSLATSSYEFKVQGVDGSSKIEIKIQGRKRRYSLHRFIKKISLVEDLSDTQKPLISVAPFNSTVSNDLSEIVISLMDNVGINYNSLTVLLNSIAVDPTKIQVDEINNIVKIIFDSSFKLNPNAMNIFAVKVEDLSGNTQALSSLYEARDVTVIDMDGPVINFIPQGGELQTLTPLITVALYDKAGVDFSSFSAKLNGEVLPSSYYQIDTLNSRVQLQLDSTHSLVNSDINFFEASVVDLKGNPKTGEVSFDTREEQVKINSVIGIDQSNLDIGNVHSCSIFEAGMVKCWGYGNLGYLGYGNTTSIGDNEALSSVGYVDVGGVATQLTSGDAHNCVILDNKKARCWGSNQFGTLGLGHLNAIGDNEVPSSTATLALGGDIKKIAAGSFHTCALKENNEIICWGLGANGRLGYGNTNTMGDDELPSGVVSTGSTYAISDIAAGTSHTCILNSNGDVKCWGRNQYSQLGMIGLDIGDNELPSDTGFLNLGQKAIAITASGDHSCALLDNNKVKCWGRNDFGQLGYGAVTLPAALIDYPFVDVGEDVLKVSSGKFTTCALTLSSKAKCFGKNDFGQLGLGHTMNIGDDESPSSSVFIELNEAIVSIAPSGNHTCAVTASAKMYCFGNAALGKLGYSNNENIGDDELPLSAGPLDLDGSLLSAIVSADINVTPSFGSAPLAVHFDAALSMSTAGAIASYQWDFGDGSPLVVATTSSIDHTYTSLGVYVATLTVTDEAQNTVQVKTAISVSDQAIKPVAKLDSSTSAAIAGSDISFSAESSFHSKGDIVEYQWDFGDGQVLVTTTPEATHLYQSTGLYLIKLKVKGADGELSEEVSISLYIHN